MDNTGRNIAVRSYLEQASSILEATDAFLEISVVSRLAPDLVAHYNLGEEPTFALCLGIRTRTERTSYHADHLIVNIQGEHEVKIPYDAIYLLTTDGELATKLNWHRDNSTGVDIAYVNLVLPIHDMPKYQQ